MLQKGLVFYKQFGEGSRTKFTLNTSLNMSLDAIKCDDENLKTLCDYGLITAENEKIEAESKIFNIEVYTKKEFGGEQIITKRKVIEYFDEEDLNNKIEKQLHSAKHLVKHKLDELLNHKVSVEIIEKFIDIKCIEVKSQKDSILVLSNLIKHYEPKKFKQSNKPEITILEKLKSLSGDTQPKEKEDKNTELSTLASFFDGLMEIVNGEEINPKGKLTPYEKLISNKRFNMVNPEFVKYIKKLGPTKPNNYSDLVRIIRFEFGLDLSVDFITNYQLYFFEYFDYIYKFADGKLELEELTYKLNYLLFCMSSALPKNKTFSNQVKSVFNVLN